MAKGYLKQIQLRIHESPEGSIFVNSDFLNSTNWNLSLRYIFLYFLNILRSMI